MADEESIDIEYLAQLARIELTESEKAKISHQLKDILHHFNTLNEVDVEGIPAMAHPFEIENRWREDKASTDWSVERSLQNAPSQRESQIVVPKVVEDA